MQPCRSGSPVERHRQGTLQRRQCTPLPRRTPPSQRDTRCPGGRCQSDMRQRGRRTAPRGRMNLLRDDTTGSAEPSRQTGKPPQRRARQGHTRPETAGTYAPHSRSLRSPSACRCRCRCRRSSHWRCGPRRCRRQHRVAHRPSSHRPSSSHRPTSHRPSPSHRPSSHRPPSHQRERPRPGTDRHSRRPAPRGSRCRRRTRPLRGCRRGSRGPRWSPAPPSGQTGRS